MEEIKKHGLKAAWIENMRVILVIICRSCKDMPIVSLEAKQLSQSLKKKGFKYVRPTICYTYTQAIGLVDNHLSTCEYKNKNHNL